MTAPFAISTMTSRKEIWWAYSLGCALLLFLNFYPRSLYLEGMANDYGEECYRWGWLETPAGENALEFRKRVTKSVWDLQQQQWIRQDLGISRWLVSWEMLAFNLAVLFAFAFYGALLAHFYHRGNWPRPQLHLSTLMVVCLLLTPLVWKNVEGTRAEWRSLSNPEYRTLYGWPWLWLTLPDNGSFVISKRPLLKLLFLTTLSLGTVALLLEWRIARKTKA